MRIAVEGCCHGQLDEIYKAIADRERSGGFKVDLLLICGDFQAIRNEADLEAMAVPRKYLELGTFHKYYSGEQVAPIPTIFIGGNHESSSYLWELYHGGWVCPNIYFLGWGNVINVGGLRIGGMSGIYKAAHYNTGHYEVSPLNDNHKRSIYHIRKFDVFKMIQVKEPLDVFLSHDWPRGIEQFGDVDGLVRRKPHFREEIRNNDLGSTPYEQILHALKPAHWFSAHLHVRFTATVPWTAGQQEQQQQLQSQSLSEPPSNPDEINIDFEDDDPPTMTTSDTTANAAVAVPSNPDEIQIGLSDDEDSATPPVNSSTPAEAVDSADSKEIKVGEADKEGESTGDGCQTVESTQEDTNTQLKPVVLTTETLSTAPLTSQGATQQRRHPNVTRFLALDKCLPKRQYLEIIDFPNVNEPVVFRYDQEWLAIVRTLDQYMSLQHSQPPAPEGKRLERELEENRRWVQENITGEKLQIPNNFVQTTPAHNPIHTLGPKEKHDYNLPHLNPQTVAFCELLQIPNKINSSGITGGSHPPFVPTAESAPLPAPPMHTGHYPQRPPGNYQRPPRSFPPRHSMNRPPRGGAPQSPYHRRPPPAHFQQPPPRPPHNAQNWRPRPPMGGPPPAAGWGGPSYPPRRPMNLPPPSSQGESSTQMPQMPRRPMNLPPPVNQP